MTTPYDRPERLAGATLAPFEGDQHAGVEREAHAARRRDLFAAESVRSGTIASASHEGAAAAVAYVVAMAR